MGKSCFLLCDFGESVSLQENHSLTLAFRSLFLYLTYRRGVSEYRFSYMGEQPFYPVTVLEELKNLGLPVTLTFFVRKKEIVTIPFSFFSYHAYDQEILSESQYISSLYEQMTAGCAYGIYHLSEEDRHCEKEVVIAAQKNNISLINIAERRDFSHFFKI